MKTVFLLYFFFISSCWAGEFVLIEPGSVYRGNARNLASEFPYTNIQQYYSQNERPVHYAFITKPFYISKHEVTVGEFRAFVEATGYQTDAEKSGKGIVGWSPSELAEGESGSGDRHDFQQLPEFTWKNPGFEQNDDHPVVGVSWNDAVAYCDWLSESQNKVHRLPTEAEWELAARADSKRSHFFWGDGVKGEIHRYANIGNVELEKARKLAAIRHWAIDVSSDPEDGFVFTAPVGSFEPNAFGLHDVSGNVLEWCQDYFNFTYYDHWMPKSGPNPVAVDPVNHSEKESDFNERRTIRGGSWYLGPLSARTSARNFFDAEVGAAYIGFRVVREASDEEAARFENPHQAYLANIEKLTEFGARFAPINRRAQIFLPSEPLTLELAQAVVAIPGAHIVRDAHGAPWTQEIWDVFADADALRNFSVRGGGFESIDLSGFAENQTELENLNFIVSGFSDAHLQQLRDVTSLTSFELNCLNGAISDAGLRQLAGNSRLTTIRISETSVSGEFLDAFESRSLLYLNVARSRREDAAGGWTREGSETLAEFAPRLVELSLSSQPVADSDLEPLAGLERLANLGLSGCPNLTDGGIAALCGQLRQLQSVNVTSTQAGPEFAAGVPRMYFLKTLRMEAGDLTDESLEQISRSRSLRSLHLETADSIAFSAESLASLWRIPNLESLSLTAPLPLGAGFENFAAAPAIRELTLHHESLTDEFVAMLPRLGTLERISITRADDATYESWKSKIEAIRPRLQVQKR